MQPLLVKETHEGDRLYGWKGNDYPSVTSIIRYGVAKPNLVKWVADKVAEAAVDSIADLGELDKDKAIRKVLRLSERARNEAAGKGTAIHAAAEAYALGKPIPDEIDVNAIQGYMRAFDNFLYDFKPTFLLTEALVISNTYGYAGTLDAVVEIEGKNYVLDIKTGSWVWPEVALQLSAYSRADFVGNRVNGSESPLPALQKRGLVLHLREDGYELRPVRLSDSEFNSFLAAIDLYHWGTDISKSAILPAWVKE